MLQFMDAAIGAAQIGEEMFNGQNSSGKQFDVINEDNEVIGSFDDVAQAVSCGNYAHWSHGKCNIRRDRTIAAALHTSSMAAQKLRMATFYDLASAA